MIESKAKGDWQEDVGEWELIERILAGDRADFEILIRRYNPLLYRVARGMQIPDDRCEDLMQEAYIKAYLKLNQFEGKSRFSTWLTRILINECLMERRKHRSVVTTTGELEAKDNAADISAFTNEPTDLSTPESLMMQKEMRALLEREIEALPEPLRLVYVLHEVQALSIREVCESLELTESNVKVRLLRARRRLRQQLEKQIKMHDLFAFGNERCDRVTSYVLGRLTM